jgi:hypothetical protein
VVIGSAGFYFFRINVLLRCLWLTLQSLNWRLWLITIFFLVLWFLNSLLHIFFRFLDELFYRAYKKVELKESVFIIANPRSGTTLLHRLITLDANRFNYMTFADTLFCSVSFVRFRLWMAKADRVLGNPLKKLIRLVEKRMFKGWEGVHNMGFGEAEEDEALFAQMMQSSGIFVLFPFLHKIKNTHCLDNEDEETRLQAMQFYKSSLQRFVYATGSNKVYLAKNVNSTGRIKSLLQTFPDAKIVFIARNPLEAVPSTASMFSVMYPLHSPLLKKTDAAYREWCELSMEYYEHFSLVRSNFNKQQIASLKYNDLLAQPVEEVEKIYQHFGWRFSDEFRTQLIAASQQRRTYKSAHTYSLEEYGYSKQEVMARLSATIAEFDFTTTNIAAAKA